MNQVLCIKKICWSLLNVVASLRRALLNALGESSWLDKFPSPPQGGFHWGAAKIVRTHFFEEHLRTAAFVFLTSFSGRFLTEWFDWILLHTSLRYQVMTFKNSKTFSHWNIQPRKMSSGKLDLLRSSHPKNFYKKGVLKNITTFKPEILLNKVPSLPPASLL